MSIELKKQTHLRVLDTAAASHITHCEHSFRYARLVAPAPDVAGGGGPDMLLVVHRK